MNLEKRLRIAKTHTRMCRQEMHELLAIYDGTGEARCIFCDKVVEPGSKYTQVESVYPPTYRLKSAYVQYSGRMKPIEHKKGKKKRR